MVINWLRVWCAKSILIFEIACLIHDRFTILLLVHLDEAQKSRVCENFVAAIGELALDVFGTPN